jgi:hypothetical protein
MPEELPIHIDTEKKMTYEEWNKEILVRNCRADGHEPSQVVKDGAGVAVAAWCQCGQVKWERA